MNFDVIAQICIKKTLYFNHSRETSEKYNRMNGNKLNNVYIFSFLLYSNKAVPLDWIPTHRRLIETSQNIQNHFHIPPRRDTRFSMK